MDPLEEAGMVQPVYPTLAAALARIEALKEVGIWPGYYQVPGGFQLSHDLDTPMHMVDSRGYLKSPE